MLGVVGMVARTLSALGAASWVLRFLPRSYALDRWLRRRPVIGRSVGAIFAVAALIVTIGALLPKLRVALGLRPGRSLRGRGNTLVGQPFPRLSGRTLGGREVTLPDDARGKATCLVCGFAYEARFDVEDWVQAFEERFGTGADFRLFELPMISNVYLPIAGAIESGMRQGTPPGLYDQIVTVYGWQRALRAELGADERSDTWVFALDRNGVVLYQYGGPYDDAHFAELASALAAAAGVRIGSA